MWSWQRAAMCAVGSDNVEAFRTGCLVAPDLGGLDPSHPGITTPARRSPPPELGRASLPTCPIPEIKRLGKTLKQRREAFLAYFDTGRANNGGTEAINGLIELHRRIARGFRNREHYRLRMLLIGGGLNHPHLR